MPYYYVETMQGCGIRSAANIQVARKSALAESGSSNFKSIRKATQSDVEWVRAMGGHIPEMAAQQSVQWTAGGRSARGR